MAEEATNDVNAEITTDIFADEVEQPTAAAPSPAETKDEAETEVEEPTPGTEETDTESDEGAPEADEEAAETDEQPKKGAEARKEQLNTEIREMVAKRTELRREIEQLTAQTYQPQSARDILQADDTGELTPEMAEIQAMKQGQEVAAFNAQVTDLNANLNTEALQVMHDFPVFDPESDQYDEALSQRAEAVYRKAAAIQTDPNTGLVYQANALPYDIYKAFAETHSSSVRTGEVKGQRATEKMLAQTDTPASAAPKPAKKDPLLELWSD